METVEKPHIIEYPGPKEKAVAFLLVIVCDSRVM